MKNIMKRRLLLLGLLILPSVSTLAACGTSDIGESFKTLFIPKADLSVTDVKSTDIDKGVSILQSFKSSGNILVSQYKFNEPQVTILNRAGLPRVVFKQIILQFTVGTTKLPAKTLPAAVTVPSGGSFSGTIPILSSADDLLNSVFPNGSFSSVQSALAEATLLGVDDNNNLVSVKFSTPVRFETDPSGFISTNPTPSSSPSSGSSSTPLVFPS